MCQTPAVLPPLLPAEIRRPNAVTSLSVSSPSASSTDPGVSRLTLPATAVMSPTTALEDFDKWNDALTKVLGAPHDVRFVRPTYDVISYTLDALCQERGLVAVLYSIGGGGKPEIVMNAIRAGRDGDIVQMHIRTDDYNRARDYAAQIESIAGYKTESWQESNANFDTIAPLQSSW